MKGQVTGTHRRRRQIVLLRVLRHLGGRATSQDIARFTVHIGANAVVQTLNAPGLARYVGWEDPEWKLLREGEWLLDGGAGADACKFPLFGELRAWSGARAFSDIEWDMLFGIERMAQKAYQDALYYSAERHVDREPCGHFSVKRVAANMEMSELRVTDVLTVLGLDFPGLVERVNGDGEDATYRLTQSFFFLR